MIYQKYGKRILDVIFSAFGIVLLSPLYIFLAILVRVKLGSPVLFRQKRPGKDGKIFQMYKFRSMTDETDRNGTLLPDEARLNAFGKKLRDTSLDELPELFNILKGDMSLVGPRPLLVRYLPLYSEQQKRRHEVKPGLTGLAQVNGRNSISWEEKFEWDVEYAGRISFLLDIRILMDTVKVVLSGTGIASNTCATMEPFEGNEKNFAMEEKMGKDVLLIAHFCNYESQGNNRFNYLAERFYENGMDVELVTSSFSHVRKCQRRKKEDKKYKTTLIYEPGYQKNVSLKRFFSHRVMGKNLQTYLINRKKPDIVYCAVPSLDVAETAARYCRTHKVPFVIDVQDLWPEAFQMVTPIPLLSNILFYPMKRKANAIYREADRIVAVSKTYAKRAKQVNLKDTQPLSVYLGTDHESFDRIDGRRTKKSHLQTLFSNSVFTMIYIGTLGHSYDIACVIEAVKILKENAQKKGKPCPVRLLLCGDGPLQKKFERLSEGLPVQFLGRLPYEEMVWVLKNSDVSVNPIKHNAAQSIINKVGDYAMAGLPVINTQEGLEYRHLIQSYECGINCSNQSAKEVAKAVEYLIKNPDVKKRMAANSRKLGEELFNRKKTYKQIIALVKESMK